MSSQALRDVRRYEEEFEKRILPEERPAFHLSSRVGWMNDPNGFSWYRGEYHLFYQYHPYDSHWGPMHWGHAVSKDLLHWKYMPAVLAPDSIYDRDGCFSGGALVMKDGTHMLMYTGVSNEFAADGLPQGVQTQCVAFGDGENYTKYTGNPVLAFEDLPEECSRYDFRDPRIWQEEDGTYKAAIVSYSLRKQKEVHHDRNSNISDGLLAS
ncbi:MAG: glycoside hydrolase family 32 protein, partial [Lachnospiraceae bacterium]|nr:glycoside hydrolase family 32 protein [Lachnospiraceae bacterium]